MISKKPRIVYIGAERVGLACFQKLIHLNKNVVAVFTYDDNLKKNVADFHPFDKEVNALKIPLNKISKITDESNIQLIRSYKPDIIFCISWSQIIPKEILDIPKLGCIGIHYSLLPNRRGAAPLNWAIIDNLSKSGITLFYMDEGTDSGDMIAQKDFDISSTDTPEELLKKILVLSPQIIEENIENIEKDSVKKIKQNEKIATYTRVRKPHDGIISWDDSIENIYNFIRGIAPPYPCAFTMLGDKKLIIKKAILENKKIRIIGDIE